MFCLKILKTLQYTRSKESIPVLIARLDDPEPTICFNPYFY